MKTFKIKATIEYEMELPDEWDEAMVDFHLNESSWCGNNAIRDIENYFEKANRCLCCQTFEVVGEVE